LSLHAPSCTLYPLFFTDPPTTQLYPLSLHDALPISALGFLFAPEAGAASRTKLARRVRELAAEKIDELGELAKSGDADEEDEGRSEEHTSELQSLRHLVCRLLLEKKKKKDKTYIKKR